MKPHPHNAFALTGIGDEADVGLAGQISALRRLDWRAIELRTVDGVAMADLDPRGFEAVRDAVREAGLEVVCLASRIGNWARPITGSFHHDLAELDVLTAQCAALGTRFIRIMSYPGGELDEQDWAYRVITRIRRLAERAEQAGLVLLHENCSGWAGTDADRMLRLLDEVGSPALRLLFDTGNGVAHGYDAVTMLGRVLPHVAHVHVKDAVATPNGVGYTLPGEGHAGVAECLRMLGDAGYTGWLSLEPHLATRPHEGLRAHGDSAELFVRAGQRLRQLVQQTTTSAAQSRGPGVA
ncbi:sugar phosphate isomerase/epimerase [Saccharopolyspora erythraea NRRL 2338]|uniref:Xylose isomerase domain protein TIM barrel n=3 Tax=Saccharopolyspora erythraea TaxID=1836 RepID=A4FEL0_SACEN|nr:sugar phosphate isomerase/epimerase family protein [Saccharopolyspora erythraea]PFG96210.1 sugar phosphate isomerase/epimerase [Saccharopolyspora erythraea NRRL 2338]QRK92738.1 sugar phosphate isomerase/epimerase [Saccharopolyspora erythraea]CAM02485.1 xylose isomerase domain protein TIM barrel [Saccharopolyspora erythraea NRRL 2338]